MLLLSVGRSKLVKGSRMCCMSNFATAGAKFVYHELPSMHTPGHVFFPSTLEKFVNTPRLKPSIFACLHLGLVLNHGPSLPIW